MNGGADLGGMMGFGPVVVEENEPSFHHRWEERAFAITVAMGFTGSWNIDASRHARETLPPGEYLTSSYYRIWCRGLEKLILERELVTADELQSGRMQAPAKPVKQVLAADRVMAALEAGGPADRATDDEPEFAVGDAVIARNMHPSTHTRLPRYVHGRQGQVAGIHGCHVFPDANAHGKGEQPHWLYSVRFTAAELWGGDRPSGDCVFVDLWEPYLDAKSG